MRNLFVVILLLSNVSAFAVRYRGDLNNFSFWNDLKNWERHFSDKKYLLIPNAVEYNGVTKKIYDKNYISVSKYIDTDYFLPDSTFTLYTKYDNQLKTNVICNYKNGIKHGNFSIFNYKNHLEFEGKYDNGKLQGDVKVYFANGKLNELLHYEHDTLDGKQFLYYPDGKIAIELLYKKDSIMDFKVFENDITFQISKTGFKWQVAKLHTNGKVAEVYDAPNEHWEDILFSNYKHAPDTLINYLTRYDKGDFKAYSPDGKLIKEIVYKKDKLEYTKNYDKNGKEIIDSMTFFTGLKTSYNTSIKNDIIDTNSIIKTEYKNGLKNGWEREYNLSGELLEETEYVNNLKHGWSIEYDYFGSMLICVGNAKSIILQYEWQRNIFYSFGVIRTMAN